ncbi:MAG: TadE/TadG family type IV pilus assembly protein [Pseudomonadota bacterium]
MMQFLWHMLRRFRQTERGATVVEFAILMPIMLVCFGAIVEGARIYWNYQAAVSGVRDATRYLARTTDADECVGRAAATTLPGHNITGNVVALQRIEANMRKGGTQNLFPLGVSITGLSTRLLCIPTPGHTQPLTPVAVVSARVQVDLPFGEVFEFFGTRNNASMITWITDQARIYGV